MAEFLNPYSPRVLKLAAALKDVQQTPVAPMFSEQELEERRRKQAFDEQMAVLAKLSGDKPLQTVGATLLPEALKAAAPRITEHGEFHPLSGEHRVFPEYGRRLNEERLARELASTEAREAQAEAQWQAQRQASADRKALAAERQAFEKPYKDEAQRIARERLGLLKAKGKVERPVTGQMYKDLLKAGEDIQNLNIVMEGFEKGGFDFDAARGISMVGEFQDMFAKEFPRLAPDAWTKNRAVWANLQRLNEMKDRYDLFGATLTGNEKTSWEKVTPPRGTDGPELKKFFETRIRQLNEAARWTADQAAKAGFNKAQISALTRGAWTPPEEPLTEAERRELEELERELGKRP